MAYFNGDRICVHNRSGKLEFGRIQEYVDVEEKPSYSGEFSNYGDVLTSDDTLFSSTTTSAGSSSTDSGNKMLRRIPLRHLVTPVKGKKRATSLSLIGSCKDKQVEGRGPVIRGMTSPVMMKRSKSQPTLRSSGGADDENDKVGLGKIKKQIVWDDCEKEVTEMFGEKSERMYRVIDRKFSVGQRVKLGGRCGTVMEAFPHATLQVLNGPISQSGQVLLMSDVLVSEIHPISSIFCGVTVELNGWIGQVCDVQRRAIYKLEDSSTITRTFYDSILIRNSRVTPAVLPSSSSTSPSEAKRQRVIHQQYPYPFMPLSEVPFTGKLEKFTKLRVQQLRQEEEYDKENNKRYGTRSSKTGDSPAPSSVLILPDARKRNKPDQREELISATVESVSTVCVKVRWIGRLPGYLIKLEKGKTQQSNQMPTTFIRSPEDINQLCPLYINPAMYFEKNGLCVVYNENQQLTITPEKKWSNEMYRNAGGELYHLQNPELVAPFNLSTITLSPERKDSPTTTDDRAKRKQQNEDVFEETKQARIIVCKHFVRHKYRVVWDETRRNATTREIPASGFYWGMDLHPHHDKNQLEHSICLGLIHSHLYVVPRKGTCMDGKCDYGIVVEKPDDNNVVVEWFKIKNQNVESVRSLKCELLDIDKHPSFNQLHEGKIVVRKEGVGGKGALGEFRFGTIVRVKRFELGQISVYCAVTQRIVDLWPHMLTLFTGMSMKELIDQKLVGVHKKQPFTDKSQN